jgi:hypothetical protein
MGDITLSLHWGSGWKRSQNAFTTAAARKVPVDAPISCSLSVAGKSQVFPARQGSWITGLLSPRDFVKGDLGGFL